MQLRVKANKKEYFDFSNISNDKHFMVQFNKIANQLIKDYQLKLISSINEFIAKQNQTNIKDYDKKYYQQEERSILQNSQYKGNNQEKPFIEKKIEFTRKEVFVLLLMMYSNVLDKDNQNTRGFYQINMELIKQSQSKQSQEKLKCIHSYFINFYNRFFKENDVVSNDSNEVQRQIQNIEKEIQEEQQHHAKKIEQLNQRIQMIRRQFLNNNPKEQSEKQYQDELVTFIRRTEFRNYKEIYNDQQCSLSQFLKNKGRCEDFQNSILVNFADKNVGGLSLDQLNIAQEEVLMLTHPEALISMLFMEPMNDNEAILIKNLIKFNDYDGYGLTFRQKEEDYFKQNSDSSIKQHNEFSQRQQELNNQKDSQNKKIIINHILCMDAIFYQNWQMQFDESFINRELVKSYIAFSLALDHTDSENISTGKWGCGIFNGDIELKFLIQLLAFSKANQDNQYSNDDFKNKKRRYISFSSFHDNEFDSVIQYYQQDLMKQTEQKYSITIINNVIENLKCQFKQQISRGFYK
ncbi:unnamed protein product [Paramecium octaurelia]|uniref:PARG catalytic Macro domain-containing protein n=1 Tax=Paramecium octaurelia TaxID=43137 RepID=A0A8S1W0D0_PAROT|nr:unnamed protein product [Paramecium octaurelia]